MNIWDILCFFFFNVWDEIIYIYKLELYVLNIPYKTYEGESTQLIKD